MILNNQLLFYFKKIKKNQNNYLKKKIKKVGLLLKAK
jgi:hypothetical protein